MDQDLEELVSLHCQNYVELLLDGIWSHYISKEKTDVVIRINEFEVKVHQMLISIFAPKLLDMFQASNLSELKLDEISVSSIFEFIYRGKLSIAKAQLCNLKKVAEEFQVKHLVDSIDDYYSHVKTEKNDDQITEKHCSRHKPLKTKKDSSSVNTGILPELPKVPKLMPSSTQHHMKKRLKVRLKCMDCDYTCDLRKQLIIHRRTEHGRKRIRKCPECDFSSTLKRLIDRHIQNEHSTDRPFPCSLCDYRAKCSADLYAHSSTHKQEKFHCQVCSTSISSKKNFNRHMKIHQNPEVHKQPHRCHLCPFRSWTKALLFKHLKRTHNYELPVVNQFKEIIVIPEDGWRCSMCTYSTKNHSKWTDHLAVKHQLDLDGNKVEPSVSCQHCSYVCFVQSQIRRHMVLSHSSKRFQCEYCDYSSYNITQVSYHIKAKHFSEKPFMCETCGMRFVTDCLLRRHVLTHGNLKFTCETCKKSFALESYLKKHVKHMHDKFAKKHMCHICAFVTKTKDALNQHIKRMHKDITNNIE